MFSKLLSGKIIEIHNTIYNNGVKGKLKLNMTTKRPSKKQVIILMSEINLTQLYLMQMYISQISTDF